MNAVKQFFARGLMVAFLFSTIVACGNECDLNTKGMCVIFDSPTYTKHAINIAVESTFEALDEYLLEAPNLEAMFEEKGVHVTFVDYDMQIDCVKKKRTTYECKNISGVNYASNDIYVEWRRCIADTAFVHELLHTIEYEFFNISAWKGSPHQPPLFYDNMENPWDSIELQTYTKLYPKLCIKN